MANIGPTGPVSLPAASFNFQSLKTALDVAIATADAGRDAAVAAAIAGQIIPPGPVAPPGYSILTGYDGQTLTGYDGQVLYGPN